ncbi:MAG TPA: Rnase Y domain-containing protein, partial [Ktedonobacterales bacterium]|nr:Rnase Y domain-containing protein [Ktedonobacterales bacterium]
MSTWAVILLVVVLGVLPGVVVGFVFGQQQARIRHQEQLQQMKETAEARMLELQEQQRDALREAKDENAKTRASLETDARERRQEMKRQEQRLQQKEEALDRKTDGIEQRERQLAKRGQELDTLKAELETLREQRVVALERVATMSVEQARGELIQAVEESARREGALRAREIEARA